MKRLLTSLNKIPSGIKNNLIIIGLIFSMIWFLLPFCSIGGKRVFAGVANRLVVFGLVMLTYSLKFIFSAFQKHRARLFYVFFQRVKETGKKSTDVFGFLNRYFFDIRRRFKKDHYKRYLKQLHWYLFLGDKQSGRKTFIKNIGLYYFKPEHFGEEAIRYVNQFPDFNWWFSEKAALIDVMTQCDETDTAAWKKFIRFLTRERKHKPFSGVFLIFSLSDLVLYSNKTRQDFLQTISNYLRDLHHYFNVRVPLYIVFNKADLVEGFMEFFNDLSREELGQIWGMTFPIENCSDLQSVLAYFMREYDVLVQKLWQRVIWVLNTERSLRGRELIYAFPQQMQLFKRPIENFISELFGSVRYHNAVLLRGVYFTSCDQRNGEKRDLLLHAMSKKFQLVPPAFKRISRTGECYFLKRLFDEIIFRESVFLGGSEKSKKISKIVRRFVLLGCPVFLIFSGIGFYKACQENLKQLSATRELLQSYHLAIQKSMHEGDRFESVMEGLARLKAAAFFYQKPDKWRLKLLISSRFLSNSVYRAMNRTLQSYFLPRAAAQIEKVLDQNISNLNFLYAALKGYLAFSVSSRTSRLAVKAPMAYIWGKRFQDYSEKNKQLQHYLSRALKEHIPKLPVNQTLIDRVRILLQSVVPSERAYGLLILRSKVSGFPPLFFSAVCGSYFRSIFEYRKAFSFIPGLYTKKGFEENFLKFYKEIAKEVAQDNQKIGLTNEDDARTAKEIALRMQLDYERQYITTWNNALGNLRLRPFQNLKDAVNALSVLTNSKSPFIKLLHIVYDNTASIHDKNIRVSEKFNSFNRYLIEKKEDFSWQKTEKTLKAIRDQLVKLDNAPDSNKASFLLLKQWIQSDQINPIAALHLSADTMPLLLKSWLNELAINCWQVIVKSAHRYMNQAWKKNVIPVYDKTIRGHYPADFKSSSQITAADFNRFFNEDGILSDYFKQYIEPFMNRSKEIWELYRKSGFSINLPESSIRLFQRAAVIRQYYFQGGSKEAALTFKLQPLTLDSRAKSSRMSLGDQRLIYRHGPQAIRSFHWPPNHNEQAAVFITDFKGRQHGKYFQGVWGLFQLLDLGILRSSKTPGVYTLSFNFGRFRASYRLMDANQAAVLKLAVLKDFTLPKNIVGI